MLENLIKVISQHPAGVTPAQLERELQTSRATINRQLRKALEAGLIEAYGNGAARRYSDADPFRATRQYFEKPHTERKFAPYREERLAPEPAPALDFPAITDRFHALEKKDLLRFLIDFSCASSVLEGGTYSLLDTQALIQYGEKAKDKPLSDAFLILNHKNAFEFLYDQLSLESVFEVHARLTDDHDIEALKNAPHFLAREYQGVVRDYHDVIIGFSAYAPPFRPGTGYVGKMLAHILDVAEKISDPLQSAFYLLTRIPYLQPFADGNKRTSRALCNVPLIKAHLPPLSFVDFGKQDYLVGLLAFYELGDTRLMAHSFSKAYRKSCERLGYL